MPTNRMPVDPDAGIPDLIRKLGDDSKRLIQDEVRLGKLETTESLHRAGRGSIWLATAFGVSVVMLVAFTLFLATLIGRAANGHMWIGAVVTGLVELGLALVFFKRGVAALKEPSYSLGETRHALKDTARWVAHPTT